MDIPTQEFSATIQFTGCPASNNFTVDANYTCFGFAGSLQGKNSAVMSIYIKGSNALRGPSTYVFNLGPALKE